jgi:hypothetical protein
MIFQRKKNISRCPCEREYGVKIGNCYSVLQQENLHGSLHDSVGGYRLSAALSVSNTTTPFTMAHVSCGESRGSLHNLE